MATVKYQLLVDSKTGKWETCKKAAVNEKGWLHYELADGTIGLLQPAKKDVEWREKPVLSGAQHR